MMTRLLCAAGYSTCHVADNISHDANREHIILSFISLVRDCTHAGLYLCLLPIWAIENFFHKANEVNVAGINVMYHHVPNLKLPFGRTETIN